MNSKTDLALGQHESKELHPALRLNCGVKMMVWFSCHSRIVFCTFFRLEVLFVYISGIKS